MSVQLVNQTTGALSPIAGGTLYADAPVGSIQAYGGATSPQGWLLCQGQSLLRTDYPELFAVIGTSFGSVDSTHFNIPDLRDKFPEGASNTNTLGSAKSAGLPNITGNASIGYNDNSAIGVMTRNANGAFTTQTDGPTYWAGPAQNVGTTYGNSFHFDASRSNSIYGKSTTVQPPSVCVNYIIKATTISLPSDFEAAVEDAVTDVYGDLIPSSASASNKLVTAAQNNFTYNLRSNTVSDLNTLTTPGVYTFTIEVADVTTAHAPTSGWLQVYVTRANNDGKYVQQMCISQGGNLYVRTSQNNIWAAWKQATMT